MKRLLLVDFSSVFRRTWEATGQRELNAAHDMTVQAIHRHSQRHDHTAVCLDRPPYARATLFPAYKATREKPSQQMLGQMADTVASLHRLGLRTFEAPGYEADDLIATFVSWAATDFEVTIYGCDKDLLQLLRGNVRMHNHATDVVIDTEALKAKLSITPRQVPCFLALKGDASDNLPGAKGIGDKRAAELLGKYRDLEGIYTAAHQHATQFTTAIATGLREAEATIYQVRELIRLKSDAPIDCDLALVAMPPSEEEDRDMSFDERDDTDAAPESEPPPADTTSEPERRPAQAPPASDSGPRVTEVVAEVVSKTTPSPAPAPTRALAVVDYSRELEPRSPAEAWSIACKALKSRVFAAYGTPEAAFLVIMAGREFGLGAVASLGKFHIIEGKPAMSAQLMMALCLSRKDICKQFRVKRSKCTAERAVVIVERPEWGSPEEYDWTKDDAQRAGLLNKNNWQKYPRAMLIARCIAEAARSAFPELLAGVYSAEELGDDRAPVEEVA